MRLQKDKIIKRAIEVLDQEGLDGLTLRRLAKELDVQAASLYYHIPDKVTLLSEMADAILEEHFRGFDFANDQRAWAEWLDSLGHGLRAAMLAHREGGRVVTGSRLGPMLMKLFDLTIRVLRNAGFGYSEASTITVTVTNFTFGFVIEEQSSPPMVDSLDEVRMSGQYPALMTDDRSPSLEEFPALMTATDIWTQEGYDMHFDTSMRIIINGVRAELPPSESQVR